MSSSSQQELSLKVMRLSRPFFVSSKPVPLEASGSILPTRTNVGGLAGGGGVGSALENEETLTNALVSSLLFPTDLTKLCPSTTALQQSTDPSSADPSSSSSSSAPSSSFSSVLGFAAISDFGLSEILRLPGSFGAIYLGETFSSYICINNESQLAIQNVGIKAELQTSTQRFTLADTSSSSPASQAGRGGGGPTAAGSGTMTPNYANSGQPSSIVSEVLQDMPASSPVHSRVSLLPSQSAEYIVHHEIKELGVHILVCSIQYAVSGEVKTFRKFYKFQVVNPLAVKTKVNTLGDGKIMLEAQVQNVTSTPMYLEQLRFEPSQLFSVSELNFVVAANSHTLRSSTTSSSAATPSITTTTSNTTSTNNNTITTSSSMAAKSVFGEGESYLHPQDTRQYLYQLDPKSSTDLVTRSTPSLGKLDIIWRTSLGQLGRLQTSQLSRKVPQMELLELAIIGMPSTIYSEEPFRATLRVTNNTSDAVHIMVSSVKAKMSSILLSGVSEKDLGWVGGRDSFKFELDFFPLLTGLHKLSGLRLTDMTTGYTRDVDNLTDILVVYSNN